MDKINWGIIGCGDVTEIKSGPAFNKIKNSTLVAVMRRDGEKARDYALRHSVAKWYNDADSLINDPLVNAIYIATPPSSHEKYAIASMQARKPVYVEKPMAKNYLSALNMAKVAKEKNVKLVVAHYRREQPFFKKIKALIDNKIIGDIRFVKIELCKKILTPDDLSIPKTAWRVNAEIAGGGLFHDLAPHQLDLAYYFFGEIESANGYSKNQARLYDADDIVTGNIVFKNGILLSGTWRFNVAEQDEKDSFEIIGSKGKISFSVFGDHIIYVTKEHKTETFLFDMPTHVQQPMIEKVVAYFLNESANPCKGEDGAKVMQLIDRFTSKNF